MNPLLKKLHVVLVLAVVLALPLLQVPSTYSAEWSAPEKVLSFLTDVVRLDMTKYKATLVSNGEFPSDLGDFPEDIVGKYTLESSESKIDVIYTFRNKTLLYCSINVLNGSPLYDQPSTTVLDAAKGLLDKYQTYEGTSHYQVMRNMLDTVNEIRTVTTTSGNVKLEISINGDRTSINWIYTSNGIDFDRKKINFVFKQGYLRSFIGSWNLYKIGSTDINVSKEQAIRIARHLAKNVSWTVHMGNDTWIEVTDFKIIDEPLKAELLTGTSREPSTLYPYWRIQLYFDKLYPGWVNGIAVAMWADTGEIIYCQTTGLAGGPPTDSSPEVSGDPPDGENPTALTTELPPEYFACMHAYPPINPVTIPEFPVEENSLIPPIQPPTETPTETPMEVPTEENELHPYVPFDELPENIKLILSEYVSPPTLELIKSGRPPNEEMIRAGVRRESFFGDIYPVYHEFGAVYIFNGSGSIVDVNGGVDTVNAPEGVITVGFSWSTEYLESIMGKRGPPSLPDTTPSFPTTLIVATTVIAAIAVVGSALLVYFTKVKKTTGKAE